MDRYQVIDRDVHRLFFEFEVSKVWTAGADWSKVDIGSVDRSNIVLRDVKMMIQRFLKMKHLRIITLYQKTRRVTYQPDLTTLANISIPYIVSSFIFVCPDVDVTNDTNRKLAILLNTEIRRFFAGRKDRFDDDACFTLEYETRFGRNCRIKIEIYDIGHKVLKLGHCHDNDNDSTKLEAAGESSAEIHQDHVNLCHDDENHFFSPDYWNEMIHNFDGVGMEATQWCEPKDQAISEILCASTGLPEIPFETVMMKDGAMFHQPSSRECLIKPGVMHPHDCPRCCTILLEMSTEQIMNECIENGRINRLDLSALVKPLRDIIEKIGKKEFHHIHEDKRDIVQKQLIRTIMEYARDHAYRRSTSGDIFQMRRLSDGTVVPYWGERISGASKFVGQVLRTNRDYESNDAYHDALKKSIETLDSDDFPFVKRTASLIGYSDGVLDVNTGHFTDLITSCMSVSDLAERVFDVPFIADTPKFDAYVNRQFASNEDTKKLLLCFIGRLMMTETVTDAWDLNMNLSGPGSKTPLINLLQTLLPKFVCVGHQAILYDRIDPSVFFVFEDEGYTKKHCFNQMITTVAGKDAIRRPCKKQKTVEPFEVPYIAVSQNPIPRFTKNRPMLTLHFEDVNCANGQNFIDEVPQILSKAIRTFHQYKTVSYETLQSWTVTLSTPDRSDCSPMKRFLLDQDYVMYDENYTHGTALADVKKAFNQYMKDHDQINHNAFDKTKLLEIHADWEIKNISICKSCRKRVASGCCDEYSRSNRTTLPLRVTCLKLI